MGTPSALEANSLLRCFILLGTHQDPSPYSSETKWHSLPAIRFKHPGECQSTQTRLHWSGRSVGWRRFRVSSTTSPHTTRPLRDMQRTGVLKTPSTTYGTFMPQ